MSFEIGSRVVRIWDGAVGTVVGVAPSGGDLLRVRLDGPGPGEIIIHDYRLTRLTRPGLAGGAYTDAELIDIIRRACGCALSVRTAERVLAAVRPAITGRAEPPAASDRDYEHG